MLKAVKIISALLILSIVLCGCSVANIEKDEQQNDVATVSMSADDIVNATEMFTDRDMNFDYEDREPVTISLANNNSKCESKNVDIKDNIITINSDGVYVLSGSLSNGQIVIDADDSAKVQLVLNGVDINCNTSAAIYCRAANKLFISTVAESKLSNSEDFVQTDDENIDSVIYSKSDLTLNGSSKMIVNASYGNSVSSNDDLAITSGEYDLTAAKHSLKGKDSVRIANAILNLTAEKDGIHSENDDDKKGFVYVESGNVTINSEDDGIQASSAVKFVGGNVQIEKSNEGIEGRFIDIAGGSILVVASDDGLNATDKTEQEQANSDSTDQSDIENRPQNVVNNEDRNGAPPSKPNGGFGGKGGMNVGSTDCSIVISGGELTVDAGGDGLDSNGIINISGGKTVVYGAENDGDSAVDYQTQAVINGGIIVALGMSGMAENFSESSEQCSILYNLDKSFNANDVVTLAYNDDIIVSENAVKSFNSVLISCPELTENKKYTLNIGDMEETIKLNSKTYSNKSGFQRKESRPFK